MKTWFHALNVGALHLENNIALAPMAGTTDSIFRQLCRRLGAGLLISELVSVKSIIHDTNLKRTYRYLEFSEQEVPFAIQLFGSEPLDFQKAIEIILAHPQLQTCSCIDINMGCPVPKVIKTGAGSALMKTPAKAFEIVKTCVKILSPYHKPVTVKIRSGWDEQNKNAEEFSKLMATAGAAMIAVHARTRQQMYSGTADWKIIQAVKAAVDIPVYGNGDVRTAEDAERMVCQTGVDGVMIGRAAQGNPWLFAQILEYAEAQNQGVSFFPKKIMIQEKINLMLQHLDALSSHIGEEMACRQMRKHFAAYLKGEKNTAPIKQQLMKVEKSDDARQILENFIKN